MTTRISRNLTAHNRMILARLKGEAKKPPPEGKPGSVAAARRAGWMSAKKAMESGK